MKKFVYVALTFFLVVSMMTTTGCTDKNPSGADSDSVWSDTDTTAADSAESLIAETPMPKAADELFDDFVFNFAANRKLQYKRIQFPLPVYENNKVVRKIEQNSWKMEHFFMRQGFYTLIFDSRKQINLVKDTTISHVVIEKIIFPKHQVWQYLFNRINGQWMMTSLNILPIAKSKNASFLKFYGAFAADTAFQNRHIANPLKFTGPDPDDDFSTMSGDLLPEQWPAFSAQANLPSGLIYNIIYGQTYSEGSSKLFLVRGIANGLEQEFTFSKTKGVWRLSKMNI